MSHIAYITAVDINERYPQTAEGESHARDVLKKKSSSSATSHHITQDSTTQTPMGDCCSSSPYPFKNYVQIKKHQHRSTVEAKKTCAKATDTGATEPRSHAREGPSLAKNHHFATSSALPSTVALVALQIQYWSHSRARSCVPQARKLSPIGFNRGRRTRRRPAERGLL